MRAGEREREFDNHEKEKATGGRTLKGQRHHLDHAIQVWHVTIRSDPTQRTRTVHVQDNTENDFFGVGLGWVGLPTNFQFR